MRRECLAWLALAVAALVATGCGRPAPQPLVANPGFESLTDKGFPAAWGRGAFGKIGKTLFLVKPYREDEDPESDRSMPLG